jgi:hypothetical protein
VVRADAPVAQGAHANGPLLMNGFISYSHDDHRTLRDFRTHLRAVERGFDVSFWSDNRIGAGCHGDAEILRRIAAAQVFVLLISPGFIASDYIYDKEIPAIQERKQSAGALVLPVVLQLCSWQLVCDGLQAVPTDNGRLKPVADWRPRANGLHRACQQIADSVMRRYSIARKTIAWSLP